MAMDPQLSPKNGKGGHQNDFGSQRYFKDGLERAMGAELHQTGGQRGPRNIFGRPKILLVRKEKQSTFQKGVFQASSVSLVCVFFGQGARMRTPRAKFKTCQVPVENAVFLPPTGALPRPRAAPGVWLASWAPGGRKRILREKPEPDLGAF